MNTQVAVIGLGYVGLNLSIACANSGMMVFGFDINSEKVVSLKSGDSYIEGIHDSEIQKALGSKLFHPTSTISDIASAEIIVIAVPTPLDEKRTPDLSYLNRATDLIAEFGQDGALVINESTSYPGTLRNEIANRILRTSDKKFLFGSAPERVDPLNAKWSISNTARIVSGLTPDATLKVRDFYKQISAEVEVVSTPEVAEASKLLENSFRQVNIAFINEFAQIMNSLQIPVHEVIHAASTKPFGFMKFQPGAGVGGHCIPVDPSYLAHVANEVGIPATFIKRANEVNLAMPAYVVKRVIKGFGGSIAGKSVVVVGVSYKANVADTRETPAAAVIDLLREEGATVVWHDDLVGLWRGEKSAPLAAHEIAVVVTKHDGVSDAAIKASGYVFDCTGTVPGVDGI